jgi:hypothetical protein
MLRSSLGPCLGRIQQRAVPEGDGRQEAHNVSLILGGMAARFQQTSDQLRGRGRSQ